MNVRAHTSRLVSLALSATSVFMASCTSRSVVPEEPLDLRVDDGWALATPDTSRAVMGSVAVRGDASPRWTPQEPQEGVEDGPLPVDEGDAPEGDAGAAGAAGSNPLSSVSKIDFIWQHLDLTTSGDTLEDYSLKGATMLLPRLKLLYEVHYWDTNVTGDDENDWSSVNIKPVFFVNDRELGGVWGMRTAVGLEYIVDFDNGDKGIGAGTDQIAPFIGFAFSNRESKTVLIPLVQHFEDIGSGPEVSTTALRVIALQPFPEGYWAKADIKLPYDWENEEWPVNGELEVGKMFNATVGLFLQGLGGVGSDRPFDWGTGIGLRVNF